MNKFWETVERINAKLIFPAVVLLFFVIIYELFLHIENHALELAVHIIDYFVIAVFVIDLIFLAIKAKTTKFFFQNYWLDILAVFPFILFSRFIRLFSAGSFTVGQAIVHESLEVNKAVSKAEKFAKVGRTLRVGARTVRIFSKTRAHFKRKKLKHARIKK